MVDHFNDGLSYMPGVRINGIGLDWLTEQK